MKVAVIGTGYVGLVVGTCLAEMGNEVVCADIDTARIGKLKKGESPIYEPGLSDMLRRNLEKKRMTFTTDTTEAARKSLVVFLAVPTPSNEDGSADLQHILEAVRQIAPGMNGYKILVNKSTVPVGTAAKVRKLLSGLTKQSFDVVSNPEFLKEGAAVDDFMKPDRVILGCSSPQAEAVMKDLYGPFVRTGHPILTMRVESAELCKYAANALLASRISFINEMAQLCEAIGADVSEVRIGLGSDRRIGDAFLFPGIGFGGSCFPKDLRALNHTGREKKVALRVTEAAILANEEHKKFAAEKIRARFPKGLKGMRFAVWGLAFKAKTDDVRESPALAIVDVLISEGASVRAYDPQAMENAKRIYGDRIECVEDGYAALDGADALVVATEWSEFRHPDFGRMREAMRQPVLFDGRNLFDPARMREAGFEYFGIGRS